MGRHYAAHPVRSHGDTIILSFAGCMHGDFDTPDNEPFTDMDADLAAAALDPEYYFVHGDFFSQSVDPDATTHAAEATAVNTDLQGARGVPFVAPGNHDVGASRQWYYNATAHAFANPELTLNDLDAEKRRYYVDTGSLRVYMIGSQNDTEFPSGKLNTEESSAGGHPMGPFFDAHFRWLAKTAIANRERQQWLFCHQAQWDTFDWAAAGEGNASGKHGKSGVREYAATQSSWIRPASFFPPNYQDIGTTAFKSFFDSWPQLFACIMCTHTHNAYTEDKTILVGGNNYRHAGVGHPSGGPSTDEWSTIAEIQGGEITFKTYTHKGSQTGITDVATAYCKREFSKTFKAVPITAPAPVAFESITALDDERIEVAWNSTRPVMITRAVGTDPSDTAGADDTVYLVGDAHGTGTVVFMGMANSFVDDKLQPNTTYHYRIYSFDGGGGVIRYNATTNTGSATTNVETAPLLLDRFTGSSIDTTNNWTLTNPNSMISQAHGKILFADVADNAFGDNNLRSQESVSSGIAYYEGVFNTGGYSVNIQPCGFYLGNASQSIRMRIDKQFETGDKARYWRLAINNAGSLVYERFIDSAPFTDYAPTCKVVYDFDAEKVTFWRYDRHVKYWKQVGQYSIAITEALYGYWSSRSNSTLYPSADKMVALGCAFDNRDHSRSLLETYRLTDDLTETTSISEGTNKPSLSTYADDNCVLGITFTTGADVTTEQTIFESGGTGNGIHCVLKNNASADRLMLYLEDEGATAALESAGTVILPSTTYSLLLDIDWTNGRLRWFVGPFDSIDKLTKADEVRFEFGNESWTKGTSWCGTDNGGVGAPYNNVYGTTGGNFLGTIDSDLVVFAGQNVSG